MIMSSFTNLKEARETNKLSQKYVAATVGVSAPTVSEWESGKKTPTVENLLKLSDLYGVTVDYLLGRSTFPAPAEIKNAPSEKDEDKERILIYYDRLNAQGKELLLAQAQLLFQQGFGEKAENTKVG